MRKRMWVEDTDPYVRGWPSKCTTSYTFRYLVRPYIEYVIPKRTIDNLVQGPARSPNPWKQISQYSDYKLQLMCSIKRLGQVRFSRFARFAQPSNQNSDPLIIPIRNMAEGQFVFVGICKWVVVCPSVRWGHVVHFAFVSLTMRGVTTVRMRVRETPSGRTTCNNFQDNQDFIRKLSCPRKKWDSEKSLF